jgi:hypothetical protein
MTTALANGSVLKDNLSIDHGDKTILATAFLFARLSILSFMYFSWLNIYLIGSQKVVISVQLYNLSRMGDRRQLDLESPRSECG